MRIERWYWIVVFCVISLFAHVSLKYVKASLVPSTHTVANSDGLVVTLAPPDPVAPTPKPVEAKSAEATPKPEPPTPKQEETVTTSKTPTAAHDTTFHKVAEAQHVRLTAASQEEKALPDIKKAAPDPVGAANEDKITNEAPPMGLATAPKSTAPRVAANTPKSLTVPTDAAGGGSLAPDKSLTGKNGAAGPENPVEDVVFNGGGAGGENLPHAPARVGGGGGKSILSVENPLAKEAIPEDKPGLNSGTGGGAGTGGGGGIGSRIGRSNGTRANGLDRIATLNSKPGNGIGAGAGSGQGTKAPGGGKGTGAETPGTGGEGAGYGKGAGIDIGEGKAPHGELAGLTRGIPFGNIVGLLGKGKPDGGGGGGPGRGGVFGQAPTIGGGGGGGIIHIIYLLDTSGSMRDGGKIIKAQDALKRALLELRPTDTFNVMNFDNSVHIFSPDMLSASRENVKNAWQYIDSLRLAPYTNLSSGIERALQEPTVTHIFIMSDGEPHGGIEDFFQLRAFIRSKNTRKVQINTLALGLGERFAGMKLLHSIADDNDGKYSYVNLFNDTATPGN